MAALLDQALSYLGLASIPGRGAKTPETRLKSANDARRLLQACIQEDRDRALERALVKGCVDGNPPYDDARRKAEGRGWEANLNLMKGRAIMNRTSVPYFNLFSRVDYFADCRTAHLPEHPDHEIWSKQISLRFHNMLKRWKPGFNWGVQQVSYWMRLHGIGFAVPEKDYDWRFRSVETGNVLVPKGSPSCLDKRVPYVFVRVPYRILELWGKIKDDKTAASAGWNVEATRNAIKYGMRGMFGSANGGSNDWYGRPWESYQRMLTNSDLTASFTDGDIVNCSIILLQEYSGKISKFIFTEHEVVGEEVTRTNPSAGESNAEFLFVDPNCYDEYQEGIIPFFRNTGDGTWHSVRGYAMEAFKHLEAENRLLCRGLDRAFLNSSVALSFANERSRTQSQLQIQGTVVKLPTGSEFKQLFMQGGMEDVVLMQRLLGNHLDNNLGVAAPRSMSRDDGRGEQPTARQVDYTAASEASISEGEITIYYEQLDSLYQTMYKRASDPSTSDEEAKRFQKECAQDGVPKEALQDMEYVRANRQSGYGSPEMGMMKFNQGKDLIPMFPEDGKQAVLEDMVTTIWGPEKTKRYAPRQHIPDDQDWQAQVENGLIADGRLPVISSGQDDVIHLQRHFEDATQTLGPIAPTLEQPGPRDPQPLEVAMNYAQIMAQHVEEHIARIMQDPTRRGAANMFEAQFRQLGDFSGELWKALRSARRANAIEAQQASQATALSALDQAKIESVRTQTALAAEKTRSTIENQRAKTVQGMGLKEAKARQELALKAREKAIEVPSELVSR